MDCSNSQCRRFITKPRFCPSCKVKAYCSQTCRLNDWYAGHQSTCGTSDLPSSPLSLAEFELKEVLGQGRFGEILRARLRTTGELFALKSVFATQISKQKLQAANCGSLLQREISLHSGFFHANVIRLFHHFEDSKCVYLALEYAEKGTLQQEIQRCQRLSESQARKYFLKICTGLRYLHSLSLIHRALHPANVLLDSSNSVKISDFSSCVYSYEVHNDHYGSVKYAAPEILQGLESSKALDIWALGVTLYEMTHGYGPFEGGNDQEICTKILTEKWSLNIDLSHDLQDLLNALLQVNPKDRPDIDAITRHPWVQEGNDSREIGSDEAERPSLSDQSRDVNPSGVGLELESPKMIPFPSPRLIRMLGTVDRRDSERQRRQHVRGWGVLQSGNTTDDEYLRTTTQTSEISPLHSPRYSILSPSPFPLLEPIPAKDLEESPSPSFTFEHILPPMTPQSALPEHVTEEKEESHNEADETDIVIEQESGQKGAESMQKYVFVSVVEDFAEQETVPEPKPEPKCPLFPHITPSGLPLRYETMDRLLSDPDVRHSFKKTPTKRHVEENAFLRWVGTFLGCTNRR